MSCCLCSTNYNIRKEVLLELILPDSKMHFYIEKILGLRKISTAGNLGRFQEIKPDSSET